jgi:hypothetical protein
MILYILGFFVLCIILFFLYIRIKYKFWALQPVFHFYDFYYWFVNVGIIRKELPEKNRYINFNNIKTFSFEDIKEFQLKEIVSLIQLNYLRNNENIYNPKKDNIVPYFIGHNTKTFWSVYLEQDLLLDNKTGKTIDQEKIIAIITGRPLHVKINNGRKDASFDVYYIDYLCVNKNKRKQNIAPQLIQTHEYNQSHLNKKISVSLFKREEELTGIIPLTVYKTVCFNLRNWNEPKPLNAKISVVTGDKQNMYYLYNFINEMTGINEIENENIKKYDITIYSEISNLMELVTTKNMFVKMLIIHGNIVGAYIFKKSCTFIEKDKEIISCIASICGPNLFREEFIQGFKVSLWSILKDHSNFKYLVVEDISDNNVIIENISIKTSPIITSPTAYFFYNFAYSPFKSEKCLIIN